MAVKMAREKIMEVAMMTTELYVNRANSNQVTTAHSPTLEFL